MLKKQISHTFEIPLPLLAQAREVRYQKLELWPEVEELKELRREQQEQQLTIERGIRLKNTLPAAVRKVMNLETLSVTELVIYHIAAQEIRTEAYMNLFDGKIIFRQTGRYHSTSPQSCRRDLQIETAANVPLFGNMIEKVLVSEFSKRSDEDRDMLLKFAADIPPT